MVLGSWFLVLMPWRSAEESDEKEETEEEEERRKAEAEEEEESLPAVGMVLSLQFSVLVYLMEAVSFAVGFHRASVAQRAQVPSTEP
jgi:hypothetical protein